MPRPAHRHCCYRRYRTAERSGNQAILRDVKKFRETDPRDPAKQDSDKVVADEDEHNFFGFHVALDPSVMTYEEFMIAAAGAAALMLKSPSTS